MRSHDSGSAAPITQLQQLADASPVVTNLKALQRAATATNTAERDRAAETDAQPTLQRRALKTADIANSESDGEGDIFDSPRIAKGLKFKVKHEVDNASWATVIAAYQTLIRPVGNLVMGKGFTDTKLNTLKSNLGAKTKWGQKKKTFVEDAVGALKMFENGGPAEPHKTDPYNKFDYWDQMFKDQNKMRGIDAIGLIDPFLVEFVFEDKSGRSPGPWRMTTQFADSGSGYLIKLLDGRGNVGGEIATSGDFNSAKTDAPNDDRNYLYSSTHEQGSTAFSDRIGAIGSGKGTRGGNAAGLDAVTWLAAEGARFLPVAALGSAGAPTSRYFIKPNPDNWTGYKYRTAIHLMQSWGTDFNAAYGVDATTMQGVVASKGKTDETEPPAGNHYNLTTQKVYNK